MVKTAKKKKSKTALQREVARLKEKKRKALKLKGRLINRQKELNEIKQLEREIEFLKGVGTKKRIAKEVSVKMGKQAGKFGWKGLKIAGKIAKNIIEAEAREQEMERRRSLSKNNPTRRVSKVKSKRKVNARPKTRSRVRAKVKNGRRR